MFKTKARKFNTPDSIIDEEVKKATGSLPVSKTKLMFGEVNEVYDVVTEKDQKVIVRISRSSHPRFEAEKLAIEEVRKVGVPTPEVLLVDKVATGEENLTFCIETKIGGQILTDLMPSLSTDELKKILVEAGKIRDECG